MIERTITIAAENGLHARPASKFVSTANEFDADVTITTEASDDDEFVPANSMIEVASLGARRGDTVVVRADGPDEAAALEALEGILTIEEQ